MCSSRCSEDTTGLRFLRYTAGARILYACPQVEVPSATFDPVVF
jgi:hypothetical protein